MAWSAECLQVFFGVVSAVGDWGYVVDFEVCWWGWGSAVLAGVVVAVEDVFACVGGDVFGVGPHGGVGCPCVGWGWVCGVVCWWGWGCCYLMCVCLCLCVSVYMSAID